MNVSFIKCFLSDKELITEVLVESRPFEDFLLIIDSICIDGVDYSLLCRKFDVTNNKLNFYFKQLSHVTQTND